MITLEEPDGVTTRLWQTQSDADETTAAAKTDSLYGYDSDETFIISLTAEQTIEYSGKVTGIRLSKADGYSSDPLTALAEWVQVMETYVNGSQGDGYTLHNPDRDESYTGAITSFSWSRKRGAKFEVDWSLAFTVGDVVMESGEVVFDPANPGGSPSLGDVDLQDVGEMRQVKKQQVETTPIQFGTPEETLVQPNGGAMRRIIIVGRVTGTNAERNNFNSTMKSYLAQNQAVTFSSGFPGRELNVVVNNFESTRSEGVTRLGEYALELVEGEVI